jgi:hypothetical protein
MKIAYLCGGNIAKKRGYSSKEIIDCGLAIQSTKNRDRICPFRFKPGVISGHFFQTKCERDNCQLWTGMYSTEGNMIYDCAFVLMAGKNSEGQIRV